VLDLRNNTGGVVFSRNFKTRSTYAAQPVSLNALLEVYVKHFRVGGDDDDDFVFTTVLGTPMGQGSVNKGKYCAAEC
jgi:hypothetical protein